MVYMRMENSLSISVDSQCHLLEDAGNTIRELFSLLSTSLDLCSPIRRNTKRNNKNVIILFSDFYKPFAMLYSLKGLSHEIGKACRWFHWIDLKFKGFCFMFNFNLNVVSTMNFLKVAPIRVRFSPGFPLGRNLLQCASRTPEELLSGANFPRRLLQRVRSQERSAPGYF
jgi:hypothetical protein